VGKKGLSCKRVSRRQGTEGEDISQCVQVYEGCWMEEGPCCEWLDMLC